LRIFSQTAVSLDGKIASPQQPKTRMGSSVDLQRMYELRDQADAILVGGETFRQWNLPYKGLSQNKKWWNVIWSRSGDVTPSTRFLDETQVQVLILSEKQVQVNASVNAELLQQNWQPQQIVAELAKRGIQNLLIEGGGRVLAQFMQAKLLQEMYITLCPKWVGDASAPSLFVSENLVLVKAAQLLSCENKGDEVYLHYRLNYE